MALNSSVHVRKLKTPKRNYKWLATFKEGEKVRKRYFILKGDAEKFREDKEKVAKEHGTEVFITAAERAVVAETREALAEVGLSLREAVALAVERSTKLKKSCTIAELIGSLQAEKRAEGSSRRYLDDLRSRLGRFSNDFGDRQAGGIEAQEITDWLAALGLSPLSQTNYRRVLVTLFAYGKRLKFCTDNPAEDAMKPKLKETPIGILTPAETLRFLTACSAEILPAMAIGLFAGVRDAELNRLDFADVDLESGFITVSADNAKSARRRLIPIRPALKAWLAPHGLKTGKVWVKNGRKLMERARLKGGFGTAAMASKLGIEVDPGNLKPWPSNAARHSFASYALADYQDAAKVALELGHADSRIIFSHYRELVKPAEAKEFWGIRPPKGHGKIIQMKATA